MKRFKLEDKIEDIKKLYHNYELNMDELLHKIHRLNDAINYVIPGDASTFPMWLISGDIVFGKIKNEFLKLSKLPYEDLEFLHKISTYLSDMLIIYKIEWCKKYGDTLEDSIVNYNGACKQYYNFEYIDDIVYCLVKARNELFPDISTSELCVRLVYGRMDKYASTFIIDLIVDLCKIRIHHRFTHDKDSISDKCIKETLKLILKEIDLDVDLKLDIFTFD